MKDIKPLLVYASVALTLVGLGLQTYLYFAHYFDVVLTPRQSWNAYIVPYTMLITSFVISLVAKFIR